MPQEYPYAGLASLAGRRIATTYPAVLSAFLVERGIDAEIVTLSGAVEIAPRLGRADLVCDLVATGTTLAGCSWSIAREALTTATQRFRTSVLPSFRTSEPPSSRASGKR